ncbi:MAG TPA: hypothetical protein VGO38_06440 [Acidimicrobiia bacterium]
MTTDCRSTVRHSTVERDGCAESRLPPFDWNDSQGEVKRVPVELLRELRDHDDPRRKVLARDLAFDLHGRAAARSALTPIVLRRLGVVQQADQPTDVAGELDVTVDDLRIHIRVEHDRCPSAEDLISVCSKQGDLLVKLATKSIIRDRVAHGGGEGRRVSHYAAVGVDGFRPRRVDRKEADLCEHPRPNQAGVPDEFEHHELSEDAPPFTPPPLEDCVDDGDRDHDDDHTRGEAGEQRVPGPEVSFENVRNDPGCQGQERSDGQYSGAAEKRFDRR